MPASRSPWQQISYADEELGFSVSIYHCGFFPANPKGIAQRNVKLQRPQARVMFFRGKIRAVVEGKASLNSFTAQIRFALSRRINTAEN